VNTFTNIDVLEQKLRSFIEQMHTFLRKQESLVSTWLILMFYSTKGVGLSGTKQALALHHEVPASAGTLEVNRSTSKQP
jgi:hypothetical protein